MQLTCRPRALPHLAAAASEGCVLPFVDVRPRHRTGSARTSRAILGLAMSSTLRLVLTAALVAIVIGITVGIVSALRQYSGFDYSHHLRRLRLLLAAVVLGRGAAQAVRRDHVQRLAARPRDPAAGGPRGSRCCRGLIWMAVLGGDRTAPADHLRLGRGRPPRRCWSTCRSTRWFETPSLGIAADRWCLRVGDRGPASPRWSSGLAKRRVLYAALAAAVGGVISFFATQPVLINPNWRDPDRAAGR